MTNWQIKKASEVIRDGGVIAYPTEAVYGFGCDPWNPRAVARILSIKRRPVNKGVIVIASDLNQLDNLIEIPNAEIRQKVMATWPGSSTWIIPASAQCPSWLTGKHSGLAVRLTAHPLCRLLCDQTGPLVSTSANIADKPPTLSAWRTQLLFGEQLDFILHGNSSGDSQPTTIRDAINDQQIR